jgi:hypothetical protein
VTLVLGPLRSQAWPITNGRFCWKAWQIAMMSSPYDVCYINVTILTLALLQDFGMCQYLGTGIIRERLCALGGGTNKNRRVK